jgi:hypothetical protein
MSQSGEIKVPNGDAIAAFRIAARELKECKE